MHQGQRIDDLEAVTAQDSVVVGAAEAMTDPNARLASLTTDEARRWLTSSCNRTARAIVPRTMPTLASDRTYQLWGAIGDEVVSLGVLGNEPTVAAFHTDPRAGDPDHR